jgi:hypothetical protein
MIRQDRIKSISNVSTIRANFDLSAGATGLCGISCTSP